MSTQKQSITQLVAGKFDRVVCINLDRRSDRWADFVEGEMYRSLPIERVAAIDGERVGAPSWWPSSPGAWGNMRTHLRLYEDMLNRGHESLLIFEDDVVLAPGAAEEIPDYLNSVPDDWDQLYLGGNVEAKTDEVNRRVRRAYDVWMAHAYAIRPRFAQRVLEEFSDPRKAMGTKHHYFSGVLRTLHNDREYKIYTPTRWLVRQLSGQSDVFKGTTTWRNKYHEIENKEKAV